MTHGPRQPRRHRRKDARGLAGRLGALALVLGAGAWGPLTCLEAGEADTPHERTANEIWVNDCAKCHGMAGDGKGELAAEIDPPVPDFTDPCRRVSDDWVERTILRGGEANHGNPAMKAHHELEDAPAVLGLLVEYVQALRPQTPCKIEKKEQPLPADDGC